MLSVSGCFSKHLRSKEITLEAVWICSSPILLQHIFLETSLFLAFSFILIFFLIQLLMQVPRERIKVAFRLWIPILVLRIVVADTWPQALGLSTLALNIIILPDCLGIGVMLTFNAEGASEEANEQLFKKILEVWKDIPSSVAFECTQRITGWDQKAIEARTLQSTILENELKRRSIKKLRFLCTRGDKLFFTSTLSNHHSRVYFMTLGKLEELQKHYAV